LCSRPVDVDWNGIILQYSVKLKKASNVSAA